MGEYRLFFVFTLEAGRVRPADKATMQMVLGAAPEIGSKYGLIINKVSRAAADKVMKDASAQEAILGAMFAEVQPTVYVNFNPKNDALEDADDVVAPLPEALENFIRHMPAVHVTSSKGSTIRDDQFEKLLDALQKDNKALQSQLDSQREQMKILAKNAQQEGDGSLVGISVGNNGAIKLKTPFGNLDAPLACAVM